MNCKRKREIAECFRRVVEQPQAPVAVADHFTIEVEHAAAAGTGETPFCKRRRRPVEQRSEARFRLRTDNRIRPGKHTGIQQVARAASERDAGEHWIRRAGGREQRRSRDVAIGRVVNPAEVVGHGIRNIVAHAHRAGVMVRGAEIVAPIFECRERRKALGRSSRRNGDHAVCVRQISNGSLPAKISAILSDMASISSHVARLCFPNRNPLSIRTPYQPNHSPRRLWLSLNGLRRFHCRGSSFEGSTQTTLRNWSRFKERQNNNHTKRLANIMRGLGWLRSETPMRFGKAVARGFRNDA